MLFERKQDKVVGKLGIPGLMVAEFHYEAKPGTASANYEGPPIPRDVWAQVLAFFKWTNDTYHSESQVRLYVNPTSKLWRAWAFPQEANTGMSAHELKRPETVEEAKVRFETWGVPQSNDWYYFGTAHHHCSCGAFQSGVDEANEKDQDGVHITVGNMNEARHSIDHRLYIAGKKFDAPLSMFWDVGDEARSVLPSDFLGNVAIFQMGKPVKDATFPDKWKENIIKLETKAVTPYCGTVYAPVGRSSWGMTWLERVECIIAAVIDSAEENLHMDWKKLDDYIKELCECPIHAALFDAMKEYREPFEDILKRWPKNEQEAQALRSRVYLMQQPTTSQAAVVDNTKNGKKDKSKKIPVVTGTAPKTEAKGGTSPINDAEDEAWRNWRGVE